MIVYAVTESVLWISTWWFMLLPVSPYSVFLWDAWCEEGEGEEGEEKSKRQFVGFGEMNVLMLCCR